MKAWLSILVPVLLLGGSTLRGETEDADGIPLSEYLLEQYFFSPNPDFNAAKELPQGPENIMKEGKWTIPRETLERLIARHPELVARLEEGVAFRKEVYDKLLAAIPSTLALQDLPMFYSEAVLKSYHAELNAFRIQEQERSKLEAETLAYDTIRKRGKYPPNSSVNAWNKKHQKEHQVLLGNLKDEVVKRPWDDILLPPKRFEAWRQKEDMKIRKLNKNFGTLQVRGTVQNLILSLPPEFTDRVKEIRKLALTSVKYTVTDFPADDSGQRRMLKELHEHVSRESTAYENEIASTIGTGDFSIQPTWTPFQKERSWIDDLLWWQLSERYKRENQAEIERIEKVKKAYNLRENALFRSEDAYSLRKVPDSTGISNDKGKLFPGLSPNHAPKNIKLNDTPLFSRVGTAKANMPTEFHYGTQGDWDPALAKPYAQRGLDSTNLSFESDSLYLPSEGVIAIPRPENFHVSVTPFQKGRQLHESEYELMEMPDGLVFLRMKTGSDAAVRLYVHFTATSKKSESKLTFAKDERGIPSLSNNEIIELEKVVTDFKGMGERPIATALESLIASHRARKLKLSPLHISEAISAHTLYSQVPGTLATGVGGIPAYQPFLNEEGRLCFQCSGASDLLQLVLSKVLVDHTEWRAKTRTVILRENSDAKNLFSSGFHRWVGLENGSKRYILEATPHKLDPRTKDRYLDKPPEILREPKSNAQVPPNNDNRRVTISSAPLNGGNARAEMQRATRVMKETNLPNTDGTGNGQPSAEGGNERSASGHESNNSSGKKSWPSLFDRGWPSLRGFFGQSPGDAQALGEGTNAGDATGESGTNSVSWKVPRLLDVDWALPFKAVAGLSVAAWQKFTDTLRALTPKPKLPKVSESAPVSVKAEPPAAATKVPPSVVEKKLTAPSAYEHHEARLVEQGVDVVLQNKILAELAKRKERNAQREANLQQVNRLKNTLLLELELVYDKPLHPDLALPHQIAFHQLRELKEALQSSSGASSLATIKDELARNKKLVEKMTLLAQDPNNRHPPDRIRQKYLSFGVTLASMALLEGMNQRDWSPFESEKVDDIKRDVLSQKEGNAVPDVNLCSAVYGHAAN